MSTLKYNKEQQEKIEQLVLTKLRKSFDINSYGRGTPLWMNICFLLDRFNKGNFYGSILIKVLGTSCNDVKETEVTHKLLEIYPEP